ncbi:isoprenylcysteine carboxylmethyltransferase family protein [Gemmata sp. G18]|uniref:Isoprenylcysteine carboxylmethyltransferase family protein n=1 Tax=Gemmata palustris TaxID=2822762 RepID=A0ABS5BY57_9BACT|nr:isoprenylcysteine carboxylmethyltransferase family protein [Gemmata palustris]MBP3958675.1 isoprenylcysteine carboxylmethyltransferase family protein [Gemmata palustris]
MSRFRVAVRLLIMPVVVGAIIFTSAGRVDLPGVWGVLGVLAALMLAMALFTDSGLMHERQKPGPGNCDCFTRPISALLLPTHWVLAGLDARFGWSAVPREVQFAGVIGYAGAMVILLWVVRTNPFYSSVVRVQADRGHRTVETGPYRFVRHPGYAATLFGVFAGALALGSLIALVPLAVLGGLFLRRTLLEDRMLQLKLPGYAEYAQRVRSRLVAGVF